MDEKLNPIFQCSLAEYAFYKAQNVKRLVKRHGLRAGLPDGWCFELMHLQREHHVPESVRDDYAFLAQEMGRVLEACPRSRGLRFRDGVSDAQIEALASAFWRIYDSVKLWYSKFSRAEVELIESGETRTGEPHGC